MALAGRAGDDAGTYHRYVAELLDLESTFSGTPFEVGDALSPAVVVQPAVPATVTVEFKLYPDSDPAQAITHTVSGQANRFGYFSPPDHAISNTQYPIFLTHPGEYRLDLTAQYWDENGVLWMGSSRGAGVVETPNGSLVGHGRHGVTLFWDNRPLWFRLPQIDPTRGSGDPSPMVVYPYQTGDVLWVDDEGFTNIVADITVQDTEGSFEYVVEPHAPQLELDLPRDRFLSGPVPVVFSGAIPSGWQNVTGTFTAIMSGYILEEGELTIEGNVFSYTFDPLRLHQDFPNLDVVEPEGSASLADTFTFTFLLSGQENGGEIQHRARAVVLQGQRLLAHEICIAGDLDCDCWVNIVDIMLVAAHWGESCGTL